MPQPLDENKEPKELEQPESPPTGEPTLPARVRNIPDAPQSVISKGIVTFEASFEATEQTTHKIYFPYPVVISEARAQVTKQLATTNSGTIILKNNAGTSMANGVITFSASAAVGTLGNCRPTTNKGIGATQYLQITVAKTTAGGRARVEIHFTKLLS